VKRLLFERTTRIHAPRADVFRFFSEPESLVRITPPSMRFRITRGPGRALRDGDRIEYAFRVFGFPMRWSSLIGAWREGESFTDSQERGPYSYWLHTHTFRDDGDATLMHDRVEYTLPLGALGRLIAGPLIRRELERVFDYRGAAVEAHFGTDFAGQGRSG
jgi:ligand-binding SRPBCC domain-containing protein